MEEKEEKTESNVQKKSFDKFNIKSELTERLKSSGIEIPTAVQSLVIPKISEGNSLIFQSETGTGKTLAYLLPLISKITDSEKEIHNGGSSVRLIITAPTIELASQIRTQVKIVSDIKTALLVGGAPVKRQIESLKEKPEIVIGTPARLLELINLKKLKVENTVAVVLDETDRLFSPEMKEFSLEILETLKKFSKNSVQIISCSATITKQTEKILNEFKDERFETVFLPQEDVLKKRITHIAIFAERRDKIETLRKLLAAEKPEKTLVFTGKLDQVENIVSKLKYRNFECLGLHAKMDKTARKSAVDKFRSGKCPVLVTSDLMSRGLDIQNITHIIQMDMPSNPDFFIHRAGRTARAGKTGTNIVIGDEYEMRKLAALEKKLGITVHPRILYKGKLELPEQSE